MRKGVIALPEDVKTPVICVGPGTGIAPMRAIIEHRLEAGGKGCALSWFHRTELTSYYFIDNTLYFGCRSVSKDEHYASEWKKYSDNGELTYRLAPSRDGPEDVKRTYVQDLIMKDSKYIWEKIGKRGAYVYISG